MDVRTALIAFILSVNLRTSASQCNRSPRILGGNGTIQSPNYGNERGKKADCTWRISGRLNSVIVLRLISLDISVVNKRGRKKACSNSLMLKMHGTKMDCKEHIHENNSTEAKCYAFPYKCKIMPLFGKCERENETESVTVEYLKKKKLSHLGRNIKGFKIEHTNIRCQGEKGGMPNGSLHISSTSANSLSISARTHLMDVTDATNIASDWKLGGVFYGIVGGAVGFILAGLGVFCYVFKRSNGQGQKSQVKGQALTAIYDNVAQSELARPNEYHRATPRERAAFTSYETVGVDPAYEDIALEELPGYQQADPNQIQAATYGPIVRFNVPTG